MKRSPLLALLAGGLVLICCGDIVGPPHPDPLPDVTKARASALTKPPVGLASGAVTVIGLPGCVAGKGLVTIETLGKSYTAGSTDQGTFKMSVNTSEGEQLAIRFQASAPAFKPVATVGVMAPRPPEPIPGVPPLTNLGGGRFRVEGRTFAGQNAPLFGINPRTAEVVLATSGAGGNFQLELAAASGDTLEIYDNGDPLVGSWLLTIP